MLGCELLTLMHMVQLGTWAVKDESLQLESAPCNSAASSFDAYILHKHASSILESDSHV
jgi:hypothetical protein